jgi:hypothetical protein
MRRAGRPFVVIIAVMLVEGVFLPAVTVRVRFRWSRIHSRGCAALRHRRGRGFRGEGVAGAVDPRTHHDR